jgi:hypothetical protein
MSLPETRVEIQDIGILEKITQPKSYFDENQHVFYAVSKVVRNAFGKDLDMEDIYQHLTKPDEVFLLRNFQDKVIAMRSHSRVSLSGVPSVVLDGAAIGPDYHGRGIYGLLLSEIEGSERVMCLRTQNPRIYASLNSYCRKVFPNYRETPKDIRNLLNSFANYLNCEVDSNFVIRGYYGGLFYGEEPTHEKFSLLFKEKLKMDLSKGDAVLLAGVR